MKTFDHYARYYDLLYQGKDYATETSFVHQRLLPGAQRPGHLLELGCGTGRHALEFAHRGWTVTGYDMSEAMVAQATDRARSLDPAIASRLKFATGDVRHINAGGVHDAAISLFHVASYQTSTADFQRFLATAARHLGPEGRFFFDFWYGPAVVSDPPAIRIKRLGDEQIEVIRLAEPEVHPNENLVLVNYEVLITDRSSGTVTRVLETHRMRYWFLPELKLLLEGAGFQLEHSGHCYTERPLGHDTWYGWVLAQKRGTP